MTDGIEHLPDLLIAPLEKCNVIPGVGLALFNQFDLCGRSAKAVDDDASRDLADLLRAGLASDFDVILLRVGLGSQFGNDFPIDGDCTLDDQLFRLASRSDAGRGYDLL